HPGSPAGPLSLPKGRRPRRNPAARGIAGASRRVPHGRGLGQRGVSQVDVRQRLRRGEPVSLEDRAVLVTGADGGIGRATVAGLIDHGCAVWAATRSESGSRALLDEYGSRIRPLVFDLTDDAATAAAAEQVTAAGPLYGVANIAGAALPGPLEQLPIDRFRRQLEINVTGQLKLTQALLPALRAGVAT